MDGTHPCSTGIRPNATSIKDNPSLGEMLQQHLPDQGEKELDGLALTRLLDFSGKLEWINLRVRNHLCIRNQNIL